MPVFSDLGLYYSSASSLLTPSYYGTSTSYTSPYTSRPSAVGYSSGLFAPAPRLFPPRYSPLLPTISETSMLPRRPLPSRISSPRAVVPKYLPPRPIHIDTADIDVSTPRSARTECDRSDPRLGTIKRGRTVVRLHTKKLKENPALGLDKSNRKKTPGERLMEKFLIKDKVEEAAKEARKKRLDEMERLERLEAAAAKLRGQRVEATTSPTEEEKTSAIGELTEADALDILLSSQEEVDSHEDEITREENQQQSANTVVAETKSGTKAKSKKRDVTPEAESGNCWMADDAPVEKCTIQRRNTVKKIRRNSQDTEALAAELEALVGAECRSRRNSKDIENDLEKSVPKGRISRRSSLDIEEISGGKQEKKSKPVNKRKNKKISAVEISVDNGVETPKNSTPKFVVEDVKVEEAPVLPMAGAKKFRYEIIVEDIEDESARITKKVLIGNNDNKDVSNLQFPKTRLDEEKLNQNTNKDAKVFHGKQFINKQLDSSKAEQSNLEAKGKTNKDCTIKTLNTFQNSATKQSEIEQSTSPIPKQIKDVVADIKFVTTEQASEKPATTIGTENFISGKQDKTDILLGKSVPSSKSEDITMLDKDKVGPDGKTRNKAEKVSKPQNDKRHGNKRRKSSDGLGLSKIKEKDVRKGVFALDKSKSPLKTRIVPKLEELKVGKKVKEKHVDVVGKKKSKAGSGKKRQDDPAIPEGHAPSPEGDTSEGINFWAYLNGLEEEQEEPWRTQKRQPEKCVDLSPITSVGKSIDTTAVLDAGSAGEEINKQTVAMPLVPSKAEERQIKAKHKAEISGSHTSLQDMSKTTVAKALQPVRAGEERTKFEQKGKTSDGTTSVQEINKTTVAKPSKVEETQIKVEKKESETNTSVKEINLTQDVEPVVPTKREKALIQIEQKAKVSDNHISVQENNNTAISKLDVPPKSEKQIKSEPKAKFEDKELKIPLDCSKVAPKQEHVPAKPKAVPVLPKQPDEKAIPKWKADLLAKKQGSKDKINTPNISVSKPIVDPSRKTESVTTTSSDKSIPTSQQCINSEKDILSTKIVEETVKPKYKEIKKPASDTAGESPKLLSKKYITDIVEKTCSEEIVLDVIPPPAQQTQASSYHKDGSMNADQTTQYKMKTKLAADSGKSAVPKAPKVAEKVPKISTPAGKLLLEQTSDSGSTGDGAKLPELSANTSSTSTPSKEDPQTILTTQEKLNIVAASTSAEYEESVTDTTMKLTKSPPTITITKDSASVPKNLLSKPKLVRPKDALAKSKAKEVVTKVTNTDLESKLKYMEPTTNNTTSKPNEIPPKIVDSILVSNESKTKDVDLKRTKEPDTKYKLKDSDIKPKATEIKHNETSPKSGDSHSKPEVTVLKQTEVESKPKVTKPKIISPKVEESSPKCKVTGTKSEETSLKHSVSVPIDIPSKTNAAVSKDKVAALMAKNAKSPNVGTADFKHTEIVDTKGSVPKVSESKDAIPKRVDAAKSEEESSAKKKYEEMMKVGPEKTENGVEDEDEDTCTEGEEEDESETESEGPQRASTSSDDSGFDSMPASVPGSPPSNKKAPSSSSSEGRDPGSPAPSLASNPSLDPYDDGAGTQQPGWHTPPACTIPRFRKYTVDDFQFLKVLGKGSFGKVLLAELKGTERYYAVKCLKKDVVLEDDDVECTLIERKVLALGTKHPYLCHLFCTFQTESHLLFVMEYLNGGDLMFHIQQSGRFQEPRARFYAAEIISGLKFLHKKGIVYRDLKLDNILLDFDGHVRIADFGMCKLQIFLDRTADTFCGTPDYMAPEIIKGLKYNQCVDWWSFGILLYEMLIGVSPFSGCDEDELFWSICNEKPHFPRFLSRESNSILTKLLEKDASKRLGTPDGGDVRDQSFFRNMDWDALERRELDPPFKPRVTHPLDVQYFDKAFTAERAKLTPVDKSILQSMDQTQFHGFSYTNPNTTD